MSDRGSGRGLLIFGVAAKTLFRPKKDDGLQVVA